MINGISVFSAKKLLTFGELEFFDHKEDQSMTDTRLGSNIENSLMGGALSRQFGMNVKEEVLKRKLKRALEILEASKIKGSDQHRTQAKVQPITDKFVGWRRR